MLAKPHYRTNGAMAAQTDDAKDSDTLTLRLSTKQIMSILGGLGAIVVAVVGAGWLAIPATVSRVETGVNTLQTTVGKLAENTDKLAVAVAGLQVAVSEMQKQPAPQVIVRAVRTAPKQKAPAPAKAQGLFSGF